MGVRKLEGGRQGGVCSPVAARPARRAWDWESETGDLGCYMTLTKPVMSVGLHLPPVK